VFVISTPSDHIPVELKNLMCIINVGEQKTQPSTESDAAAVDPAMTQIAELYGARDIVRNSKQLVEAAFDGDLDEIKAQIDKGYHMESMDGRKQTALSEASCQGHLHVVNFLLEQGADPNAVSDTGRSPMWRAAFNQHIHVVTVLLEAGGNPEARDRVSMESVFDVSQSEELRTLLVSEVFTFLW
jgi:ankyrin repeat protein